MATLPSELASEQACTVQSEITNLTNGHVLDVSASSGALDVNE